MKFLGIVALVGLISANNLDSDLKAAQTLLNKKTGLNQKKINNALKNAEIKLRKSVNQAEQLAEDNGIKLDLNKIFNDFKKNYGDDVQKAADNLLKKGENLYNNNRGKVTGLQNNKDVQRAKNIGFQQLLIEACGALTEQVDKLGNAKLKNNLKNLIDNGKRQASQELKKAGLTGKISKKAEQEFKKNGGKKKVNQFANKLLADAKAAINN